MRSLAWGIAVWVLALPGLAEAFCRTTTCRSTTEKTCGRDDRECVNEGTPLFWPSRCVGFSFQQQGTVNLVPEDTKQAILGAFATWSEHECPSGGAASIVFSPTEDVPCKLPQANKKSGNVNVVFFRDDEWPYRGIDGTLATTTVTYDGDGSIWDADIAVNSAFNNVTLDETNAEYDVPSIVIHEVGHFLGIAHSDNPDALMYASYLPGTVNRELTPDDIDALCTIYPPDRQASCDPEPRGGFAPSCSETTTGEEDEGGCRVTPRAALPDYGVAAVSASAIVSVLALLRRRSPSRRSP